MKERDSACKRNPDLVRRMAAEGASLTEIGRTVGTNRHRVLDYIERHAIPHPPFLTARPLAKNGRWRGGRIVDKDGYVLLKRPDHPAADRHGYVREHRLVMEGILRRFLGPKEVVHHTDRDKLNNSPDNLRLFVHNADYLKDELTGKMPNWTPEGRQRTLEALRQPRPHRRKANLPPT